MEQKYSIRSKPTLRAAEALRIKVNDEAPLDQTVSFRAVIDRFIDDERLLEIVEIKPGATRSPRGCVIQVGVAHFSAGALSISARTIVIATDACYNKPTAVYLDRFAGRGIHYSATHSEAQL